MTNDHAFKDNEEAFEFACKELDCDIARYKALPGMVMNASDLFNVPERRQTRR